MIRSLALLFLLTPALALADAPKSPLTIQAQARLTPDGAVEIEGSVAAPESIDAELRVSLDAFDQLSGPSHRTIALEANRSLPIHFRVVPQGPGNHRVEINVHADRGAAGSWGDQFSFFYQVDEHGSLSAGWRQREPFGQTRGLQRATQATSTIDTAAAPGPVASVDVPTASPGRQPGTDGNVTVSGYWYMYDQNNNFIPQRERRVYLLDAFGTRLAGTNTDFNGYYQFGAISNPHSLSVQIYTEVAYNRAGGSDLLRVTNAGGTLYYTETGLAQNVPDGNYSMGTWYTPDGDLNEPAYWAFNTIQDTWRYFYFIGVPNSYAGSIWAEWYPGSTEATRYNTGGHIHLDNNDPLSRHIVAHEAGHNVMNTAYEGNWPLNDCPSPHLIDGVSGIFCAWTEGWADWVSAAVTNNPVYWDSDGWSVNLETRSGFSSGDRVEGNVAAAIWDIIDSNNEPSNDFYTDSVYPIWDTVWSVNDGIFCAFWNSTRDHGIKRSRDNCLHQATIDSCNTCLEDAFENDDSCLAAKANPLNVTSTHEHCTDVDWVSTFVEADWTYVWRTDDLGYSGDTLLDLFGNDCAVNIKSDDDGAGPPFVRASRLEWRSDRTDTVRVGVSEFGGYATHKSYDISVSRYCSSPSVPTNLSPAQGQTVCGPQVTLQWQSDASQFQVILDGSYYFPCYGISAHSCTVTLPAGNHLWQVVSSLRCSTEFAVSPVISFNVLDSGNSPAGYPDLTVDASQLSWTPLSDAYGYDAVKGSVAALLATGGDFAQSTTTCLGRVSSTTMANPDQPSPGDALYFLVRPRGCVSAGSYDDQDSAVSWPRDPMIEASPGRCP